MYVKGLAQTERLMYVVPVLFRDRLSFCSPGWPGTNSITQAWLKFTAILLLQLPEGWDYKLVPPCLAFEPIVKDFLAYINLPLLVMGI